MKRMLLAVLLLACLPVLAAEDGGDAALESRARDIEGKIMAPCCMANTVAEHYSPIAGQIRQEIREKLREGQTSDQILAFYAAEYGDQILAMPAAKGFNLVVWLVPMVFLLVGPGVIYLVLRGWKAKEAVVPATPAGAAAAAIDPKYAERLRQSLADLD